MNSKTRRTVSAALAAAAASATLAAATPGTASAWLHVGSSTQYPSAGGKWEYGFWNAKVRSYYTVNRCHGSAVRYNGNLARSADTAAGATSVATKWAVNYWSATDDYYYRTC